MKHIPAMLVYRRHWFPLQHRHRHVLTERGKVTKLIPTKAGPFQSFVYAQVIRISLTFRARPTLLPKGNPITKNDTHLSCHWCSLILREEEPNVPLRASRVPQCQELPRIKRIGIDPLPPAGRKHELEKCLDVLSPAFPYLQTTTDRLPYFLARLLAHPLLDGFKAIPQVDHPSRIVDLCQHV